MYKINGSCYIRIPFTLANADFSNLLLRVRYDDGFIAYLNGAEVARRNFTGEPRWNSVGSADNPDAAAVGQTTIDISDYVGLLGPGANLLAIHGLNGTIDSSDFLISVELVGRRAEPGDGRAGGDPLYRAAAAETRRRHQGPGVQRQMECPERGGLSPSVRWPRACG